MKSLKKFAAMVCSAALACALVFGGTAFAADDVIELQIGFENSITEPFGQGIVKWAELLDKASGGTMKITPYPDSQLGSKNELIDSMLIGEPVCTLADGAFYADYGVPDFGIVFSPFLFDNWEQCWKLIDSDWYKDQCAQLEKKGLKVLVSNWVYGARHTLTVKPVNKVEDLAGMKIRVPNNQIQSYGFDCLGAVSTGMDLGDVYSAMQTKTIDGAENPLATLYGRKLHEVGKYLILDGHVLNFTTLVCSADWFNSLTEQQQKWLVETGIEAGKYNNEVQAKEEANYLKMMKDDGVTVVEPTQEVLDGFRAKAQDFYKHSKTYAMCKCLHAECSHIYTGIGEGKKRYDKIIDNGMQRIFHILQRTYHLVGCRFDAFQTV